MKYKTILCLSSYRRPHSAAFQITRLLSLASDYDLSVSIKGVSEYEFRYAFEEQWRDALDSGRLHLSFHPNRGQAHNMLDPMRDECDGYELFIKIDDDDFYTDRYFEEVESYYEQCDPIPMLTLMPEIGVFKGREDLCYREMKVPRSSGPTLVLSQEFVKHLLSMEARGIFSDQRVPEDGLWVKMAASLGGFKPRPVYRDGGQAPPLIYNMTNTSWSRGGYIPSDVKERYRQDPESTDEELNVYLIYPDGGVSARIFGEDVSRGIPGEAGKILVLENGCLSLLWNWGGREVFHREASGGFRLVKGGMSSSCHGFRPAGGTGRAERVM